MPIYRVTFASEARGLRTIQVHAGDPVEAEEQAGLLLVLEALDAEMVGCELVE